MDSNLDIRHLRALARRHAGKTSQAVFAGVKRRMAPRPDLLPVTGFAALMTAAAIGDFRRLVIPNWLALAFPELLGRLSGARRRIPQMSRAMIGAGGTPIPYRVAISAAALTVTIPQYLG